MYATIEGLVKPQPLKNQLKTLGQEVVDEN